MRLDRLTSKFQVAISDAQSLALGRDHQFIEPVHLMTALLNQDGGSIRPLLTLTGMDINTLRSRLGEELDRLPKVSGVEGDVQLSNGLGRLLNICDKLAQQRKDQFISSELFVLAALDEKGNLGELLRAQGLTKEKLEQAIDKVRGGKKIDDANAEENRQALEKYTIDLTERAELGKLDPVIGRDEEIRRTIQVLQRRTKNNPVLIGEPGVGKSAIVEGLALRIIQRKVSRVLFDKRVISLDMASIVAGTKYRGQFEERMKAVMNELEKNDDIILFIDEIHRLSRSVEEILYPSMEDFAIDIITGKGQMAASYHLPLPKFTLVGATTRAGQLTAPLRDRFGVVLRLELYTPEALAQIVERSAGILGIKIEHDGALEIASRSRGTPRIANRLLKRVRDFAQVKYDGVITKEVANYALDLLDVDKFGLDHIDRNILITMIEKFQGGPVGLETLAASISEDAGTLEDVYEPYLMQIGFLSRTPRGRIVTPAGYRHLGIDMPGQQKLDL